MAAPGIRRVGVVGLGAMGAGIAQLAIEAGYDTIGREVTKELGTKARDRIAHFLQRKVDKEQMTAEVRESALSSLTLTTELGDFADCDLIVEAIIEDLGPKLELFADLERIVRADTILATNTSALSVTAMAAGLAHPARVVGLHFFNPVAVLPLVEIVRTDATDGETLATAWDVVRRVNKRGVVVRDAPGFVVNRLLTRQSTVLMQALDQGATFEETDEAALRLGLPMPPSALLAMVGPRVANHVLLTLNEAWPDRFPRSSVLQALADGEFPALEARDDRPSVDEIHERLLAELADEARRILDEGVVPSAAALDACLILGAGFPFFRGGITPYLDRTGVSERVSGRPLGRP